MPKSPEQIPYQPSAEEIKKAEEMMTEEQKAKSLEREETLIVSQKIGKRQEQERIAKSNEKIEELKEKLSRIYKQPLENICLDCIYDGSGGMPTAPGKYIENLVWGVISRIGIDPQEVANVINKEGLSERKGGFKWGSGSFGTCIMAKDLVKAVEIILKNRE